MDKILAQDSNSVLELLQKSRIVKFDIQVLISFSHLADELIVICKMCRIPRMARLCFCVFHEKKGRKTALTWVNMNIFDNQRNISRFPCCVFSLIFLILDLSWNTTDSGQSTRWTWTSLTTRGSCAGCRPFTCGMPMIKAPTTSSIRSRLPVQTSLLRCVILPPVN